MTKNNKKILNLAENLFSLIYLLNNYIKESREEEAYYLKGTIRQIFNISTDLHYEISKLSRIK